MLAALCAALPEPSWSSLQFVEARYGGPVLDGAYGLAASSDGNYLYATGYYDGVIAVFSRDGATGRLTFGEAVFDDAGGVDGLAGAIDMAVSPDGGHLYVCGWFDDNLVLFSRDSGTGGRPLDGPAGAFSEAAALGLRGHEGTA